MERAMLYMSKSQKGKYTQEVNSPLQKQAFEVAMKMNEKAKETVLSYSEQSFERKTVVPKKVQNTKQKSAVELFGVTKGSHSLHLEHKKVKKKKDDKKAEEKEERKLEKKKERRR